MIKIMLVDDEHLIRAGLRSMIEKISVDYIVVAEAGNGYEAMALIRYRTPDIVVLDIKMPEMSGLELGEWIKENYPKISIVFLSGYAEFSLAQSAIKLGAEDYILKPTRREQIEEVLQRLKQKIYTTQNHQIYADLMICEDGHLFPQKEGLKRYGVEIEEAMLTVKNVTYRAVQSINQNYEKSMSLKHLSEALFINQTYLSELFKKETQIAFALYVTITRLEHARILALNNPQLKVYEISKMVGIEDAKYFSQVFKRYFGVKPSKYLEHVAECQIN